MIITRVVIAAALFALSACSSLSDTNFPGVYKMDIQQGNIISEDKVDLLQIGLTKDQVRYVMGSPLVVDIFNDDHWDYVYQLIQGDGTDGATTKERVRVVFKDGLVIAVEKHNN